MHRGSVMKRLCLALAAIAAAALLLGAAACATEPEPTGEGTLSVLVKGPDGPIALATIQSNVQPPGQSKIYIGTGKDGTVIIPSIRAGEYWFQVTRSGYVLQEFNVTIVADGSQNVTVTLVKAPD